MYFVVINVIDRFGSFISCHQGQLSAGHKRLVGQFLRTGGGGHWRGGAIRSWSGGHVSFWSLIAGLAYGTQCDAAVDFVRVDQRRRPPKQLSLDVYLELCGDGTVNEEV